MIKISPSILSANFGRLNKEIKEVEAYVDSLHIDIMDGHLVDNISYGPVLIKDIKTSLPIDCHLMVTDPIKYAKRFVPYVDRVLFHISMFDDIDIFSAIEEIKMLKVKVGLALNVNESVDLVMPYLDMIDAILIMSVNAGFGGQKFIPNVLDKIKMLRSVYKKDIIIDGGISPDTIKQAYDAGANVFVAGSSIFKRQDRYQAIQDLKNAAKKN